VNDLRLSACVELLFAEGSPPIHDRIRAAAAAGCEGVEFWGWRDRQLDSIAEAVAETGVTVPMTCVQPMGHLVDASRHAEFVSAVAESVVAASEIGCRNLVVTSGGTLQGVSAREQDDAIVSALQAAAPIVRDHGIKILLEPLNTRVDHPGTYLFSTKRGLDLVELVNQPEVGLLYDVYHSVMMGERPAEVLDGRGSLVGHVHVADLDGRHEPGTGTIDWRQTLADLRDAAYRGPIGLEYWPTVDSSESVRRARMALTP
jgi:hydroxypyruvate isomerase